MSGEFIKAVQNFINIQKDVIKNNLDQKETISQQSKLNIKIEESTIPLTGESNKDISIEPPVKNKKTVTFNEEVKFREEIEEAGSDQEEAAATQNILDWDTYLLDSYKNDLLPTLQTCIENETMPWKEIAKQLKDEFEKFIDDLIKNYNNQPEKLSAIIFALIEFERNMLATSSKKKMFASVTLIGDLLIDLKGKERKTSKENKHSRGLLNFSSVDEFTSASEARPIIKQDEFSLFYIPYTLLLKNLNFLHKIPDEKLITLLIEAAPNLQQLQEALTTLNENEINVEFSAEDVKKILLAPIGKAELNPKQAFINRLKLIAEHKNGELIKQLASKDLLTLINHKPDCLLEIIAIPSFGKLLQRITPDQTLFLLTPLIKGYEHHSTEAPHLLLDQLFGSLEKNNHSNTAEAIPSLKRQINRISTESFYHLLLCEKTYPIGYEVKIYSILDCEAAKEWIGNQLKKLNYEQVCSLLSKVSDNRFEQLLNIIIENKLIEGYKASNQREDIITHFFRHIKKDRLPTIYQHLIDQQNPTLNAGQLYELILRYPDAEKSKDFFDQAQGKLSKSEIITILKAINKSASSWSFSSADRDQKITAYILEKIHSSLTREDYLNLLIDKVKNKEKANSIPNTNNNIENNKEEHQALIEININLANILLNSPHFSSDPLLKNLSLADTTDLLLIPNAVQNEDVLNFYRDKIEITAKIKNLDVQNSLTRLVEGLPAKDIYRFLPIISETESNSNIYRAITDDHILKILEKMPIKMDSYQAENYVNLLQSQAIKDLWATDGFLNKTISVLADRLSKELGEVNEIEKQLLKEISYSMTPAHFNQLIQELTSKEVNENKQIELIIELYKNMSTNKDGKASIIEWLTNPNHKMTFLTLLCNPYGYHIEGDIYSQLLNDKEITDKLKLEDIEHILTTADSTIKVGKTNAIPLLNSWVEKFNQERINNKELNKQDRSPFSAKHIPATLAPYFYYHLPQLSISKGANANTIKVFREEFYKNPYSGTIDSNKIHSLLTSAMQPHVTIWFLQNQNFINLLSAENLLQLLSDKNFDNSFLTTSNKWTKGAEECTAKVIKKLSPEQRIQLLLNLKLQRGEDLHRLIASSIGFDKLPNLMRKICTNDNKEDLKGLHKKFYHQQAIYQNNKHQARKAKIYRTAFITYALAGLGTFGIGLLPLLIPALRPEAISNRLAGLMKRAAREEKVKTVEISPEEYEKIKKVTTDKNNTKSKEGFTNKKGELRKIQDTDKVYMSPGQYEAFMLKKNAYDKVKKAMHAKGKIVSKDNPITFDEKEKKKLNKALEKNKKKRNKMYANNSFFKQPASSANTEKDKEQRKEDIHSYKKEI